MSAPQHSPLPWHVDPSYPLCIEAKDGNVALMNLARANPEDSALIVRAVNSHQALVDALTKADRRLADLLSEETGPCGATQAVRDALALATPQPAKA